jgi:hypothetical protein
MIWTFDFLMEAVPSLAAVLLLFYIGRSRYGVSKFQRFLVSIGVKQTVLSEEIEEWVAQSASMSLEDNQESLKYFNGRIRQESFEAAKEAGEADPASRIGLRSIGRSLFDGIAFVAGVVAISMQGPELVSLFQTAAAGLGN